MIATGSISGSAGTRLFTLWLDERGRVAEPQIYLADTDAAVISDWSNPLVRTRNGFALVWSRVSKAPRAAITEIAVGSATELPLAQPTSRRRLISGWRSSKPIAESASCASSTWKCMSRRISTT